MLVKTGLKLIMKKMKIINTIRKYNKVKLKKIIQ